MLLKKLTTELPVIMLLLIFTTGCNKVKIPDAGDPAPGFTLKNQMQMNVTLSNFRGKRNVILVFYPLDFTSI